MNLGQGKRLATVTFGVAAVLMGAATSKAGAGDVGASPAPQVPVANEAPSADRAMLWKYVARCALAQGQSVEAPDGSRVEGALGLGPEWRDGTCDSACQEKVSACLFALTNPTGKHVQLSLLGHDASLPKEMRPSESDLPYGYQEGAFFGNVFASEAYVCRGRDAAMGAQVKRWCAIAPALCSGLATFVDAGPCDQVCEMSCSRLSDGSSRCVAASCRDPKGKVWQRPITTYLRDRIEAGNADTIAGATSRNEGLERIEDGATATFQRVDFRRGARTLVANLTAPRGGGRIEIWLGTTRRLGVLAVPATGGETRDVTAPLSGREISGEHEVVLRFTGLERGVRLANFGLR